MSQRSLEEVLDQAYYSAAELRAAYGHTPMEIRQLYTADAAELAGDGWLIKAVAGGQVPLYRVPVWTTQLASEFWVPSICMYPSKSMGAWRIYSDRREWYVYTSDLVDACKPRESIDG
jgi:hypothetical protein